MKSSKSAFYVASATILGSWLLAIHQLGVITTAELFAIVGGTIGAVLVVEWVERGPGRRS